MVTEVASDGVHYVGHDKQYHQVLIAKDERVMGRRVDVFITSVSKWSLKGEVVEGSVEGGV